MSADTAHGLKFVRHAVVLVAVILSGLGMGVPSAAAAVPGVTPDQLTAAQQVAASYWYANACAGTVAVMSGAEPASVTAWASWSWRGADAPANYYNCSVTFNDHMSWSDYPTFCSVLVHEYGHLTGHQHSTVATADDPEDAMNPVYQGHPIQECHQPLARSVSAPTPTAHTPTPSPAPATSPASPNPTPSPHLAHRRRTHQ